MIYVFRNEWGQNNKDKRGFMSDDKTGLNNVPMLLASSNKLGSVWRWYQILNTVVEKYEMKLYIYY